MTPVLVVFMLLNGQPVGDTVKLLAAERGCRVELAAIRGMNQALSAQGVEFVAACEDHII